MINISSTLSSRPLTSPPGSLLGTREALRIGLWERGWRADADGKVTGGCSHTGLPGVRVFNYGFSEAGATLSPSTAVHRSTRRGVAEVTRWVTEELRSAKVPPNVALVAELSPGLVLTPLLLADTTATQRRLFNALAEEPETAAEALAPMLLAGLAGGPDDRPWPGTAPVPGQAVCLFRPSDAPLRILARLPEVAGWVDGRFFDRSGVRIVK